MAKSKLTHALNLVSLMELREGGTITTTEIRSCQRLLNKVERKGSGAVQHDEYKAYEFLSTARLELRVCEEQAAIGLAYLKALVFRKDGGLRDTKLMRERVVTTQHVANILNTFSHFELVDFDAINESAYRCSWYPRYRVCGDGSWPMDRFVYTAVPWQSGQPIFSV